MIAWCDHAHKLPEKFSQDSIDALCVIGGEECDKLVSSGWPLESPYNSQASTARHSIERQAFLLMRDKDGRNSLVSASSNASSE
jgi:hypothetical protein